MNRQGGIWLAVSYKEPGWYSLADEKVTLFEVRSGNHCHYDGGVARTTWPKDAQVAHAYGFEPDDDDGTWLDGVYEHFENTFRKIVPHDIDRARVKDADGWLSPEGVFYRCGYSGHSSLAKDIVEQLNITTETLNERGVRAVGGDFRAERLHDHGWIAIGHGRVSANIEPTEAQIQFLTKLRQLNSSFLHYSENIDNFFRWVKNDKYPSRPE